MIKQMLVAFAAVLSMHCAYASPINIVTNGDFSASTGPLATGWAQAPDPDFGQFVATTDPTDPGNLRHGGHVFTDGAFNVPGVLSQLLTTVIGAHYSLSFDAQIVRDDASTDPLVAFVRASFNGVQLFNITTGINSWGSYSTLDLIATSTSTWLEFDNSNSLNYNILDNIVVTRTDTPPTDPGTPPTGVPEPTSVALLLLGLGLLARREARAHMRA